MAVRPGALSPSDPMDPVIRRLPLWGFLAVYVLTCYLGALALVLSEPFRGVYLFFSGARLPDFTSRDLVVVLALLHAGPLLLWLGFEAGLRIARRLAARPSPAPEPASRPVGLLLFLAAAAVACWSLARAGGLFGYEAWLTRDAFLAARWELFERLTFFEFVNLYTVLPLLGGYVILSQRRWLTAALVGALLAVIQYPMANRKAMLTSAILIAAAVYTYVCAGWEPRRRAGVVGRQLAVLAAATVAVYALYLALTLPILREVLRLPRSPGDGPPRSSPVPDDALRAVGMTNTPEAFALYLAAAPFTRTSLSAVVYPAIFPRLVPYYPLDVGLDIIRIGRMPDDNRVVHGVLYGIQPKQTVSAPFHVVLYSQGGVPVALAGSLIMGLALGAGWALVLSRPRPSIDMSLFGSLLAVLAVFLAIDAVRNSLVVSYGLVWGLLTLLAVRAADVWLAPACRRLWSSWLADQMRRPGTPGSGWSG